MTGDKLIRASQLLATTYDELVQGFAGLVSSDRHDLALSVGHVLRKLRSIGFVGALQAEWERLVEKGTIKDDYVKTDQHLSCLQEVLDALDSDLVDEMRFNLMKKIFLVAASEISSSRDDLLPQQLMCVARSMSSGEIVVLSTAYHVLKCGDYDIKNKVAQAWLQKVADQSGLKHTSLVEMHEETLVRKHLLSPRVYGDASGVQLRNYRLTDLALELCEFIQKYDDIAF